MQGSWVNLREPPRAGARVLAQVPANTVQQQLADRGGRGMVVARENGA